MADFSETLKTVQDKTGTRGFGAKKRTAAELISSEMKDIGPLSGIAGQILSDLAVETAKIEQATDPEELKDIGKRIREFKGIINQTQKNLSDDSKMSEEQLTALRKVINASDKNIKRAGRGLFGKANESFLDSLTETLNPFTKIGDVFAQLPGGAPFEAYFNSLGDGINDKIKGALGIGGLTDDNVEKVEQYVSGKQDLEETQSDYEDSRPKTKSDFVADPTELNDQQPLTVKDILTPPIGMLARIRRTLAFGLGLTDKSGQSFLLKISEALEGRDPSATEGANVKPDDDAGIPSLEGEGGEKGGIMGFLSGLVGAAGAALAAGITALSVAIRGLATSMMMLANPAALLGLAAFTAAVIGIGFALKIAAPGLKVFADAIVDIVDILGETFLGAMERIPPIFDSIGGVIKDVGESISGIVSTIFDSIAETVERLSALSGADMLEAAAGIVAISAALGTFAVGGILGAIGSFFGGGPLDQLQELDGENIKAAGDGLEKFGKGLKTLDADIAEFGKSDAPRILKDFSESMEGFKDSLPGVVAIGKMTAFGLAFKDLKNTAQDFVREMTVVANPEMAVNVGTTAALTAGQSGINGAGGSMPSVNTAVTSDNRSSSVVTHNHGSKPINDFFDQYSVRASGAMSL
jgi:hypothetical protein